ncbi:MAG: hypothetical protein GX894_09335 [Clostridia bacterium]|nr:hypothetical protein [Clostridia bacterium]
MEIKIRFGSVDDVKRIAEMIRDMKYDVEITMGDGAGRYIATGNLKDDCRGENYIPIRFYYQQSDPLTKTIYEQNNVPWWRHVQYYATPKQQ